MSSSVFIERNDKKKDDFEDYESVDSDLVLVYKKNKINLDHTVLENLIDEKRLSTISVVRIVSPTPSMVEDDRASDFDSKDIESDYTSDKSSVKVTSEDENASKNPSHNENSSDDEGFYKEQDECSTNRTLKQYPKLQKYFRKKTLLQNTKIRKNNQDPYYADKTKLFGLSIEAFLTPEKAKQISREALKQAGISPFKKSSKHDFQLYVINNDHCYTPLLSPSQHKPKKQIEYNEPKNPTTPNSQPICIKNDSNNEVVTMPKVNVYSELSIKKTKQMNCEVLLTKTSSAILNSNDGKQNLKVQKCRESEGNKTKSMHNFIHKGLSINNESKQKLVSKFSEIVPTSHNSSRPQTLHIEQNNITQLQPNIIKSSIRGGPTVQIEASLKSSKLQTTSNIKEIVLNKVTKSGGGKFTNITTLLSDSEPIEHTKPQPSLKKPSKGFMPLIGDSLAKSSLPSQISIQTHQSSFELAAERDKQLDLIDSIVQDEMQKSTIIDQTPTLDENIPKLVKMLENTENILESGKIHTPDSIPVANIDNDMPNQMELNDNITGLPVDLLQHVVDLIEDNNTLREAVDQQVFKINKSELESKLVDKIEPPKTLNTEPTKSKETSLEVLVESNAISESTPKIVTPIENTMPVYSYNSSTSLDQQKDATKMSTQNSTTQIVRGNGRVITLPPIEAPTTRAKRRAQTSPVHTGNDNSFTIDNVLLLGSSPERTLTESKIDSIVKENVMLSTKKLVKKPMSSSDMKSRLMGNDKLEKDNDDDDPNKLWCICRQPHNNRFMICCDVCGDWFHGTCVNVTKAIGLEMEHKGIEWTCPNCIKKKEEKKQPKITDMMIPLKKSCVTISVSHKKETVPSEDKNVDINTFTSMENKNGCSSTQSPKSDTHTVELVSRVKSPTITSRKLGIQNKISVLKMDKIVEKQLANDVKIEENATTKCIVCKKTARDHSIYCSDECIRKHVHHSLNTFYIKPADSDLLSVSKHPFEEKKKKSRELFEDVLSMADRKHKVEKVHVLERASGKLINGSNAPTTVNIKKWLQDNPTFEIVRPENTKCVKNEQLQQTLTNSRKNVFSSKNPFKETCSTISSQKICASNNVKDHQEVMKSNDPIKQEVKCENRIKERMIKRQAIDNIPKKQGENSSSSTDPEPIRLNIRRTLKEQLMLRMKELPTPKLTESEIEEFALETEQEMYNLFNRDIGSKYKAKYRSLIFNIKDRKNHTLFTKICEKRIEPKQLIKMSPEELASQELARWREKEAKHQLDMITKSELDLLACSKTFVLKTHKGEEEIESKSEDINSSITLDDVVTTYTDTDTSKDISKDISLLEQQKYSDNDSKCNIPHFNEEDVMQSSIGKNKETSRKLESEGHDNSTNRDKHCKNRHKDKYKPKKRHRSCSRSRSRSREKKRKSSHKDLSLKVEHNDLRDNSNKHKKENKSDHESKKSSHQTSLKLNSSNEKRKQKKDDHFDKSKKPDSIANFNLIDQILSSSKSIEEAANILPEKQMDILKPSEHSNKTNKTKSNECSISHKYFIEYNAKHQRKLLWTGIVNMVDVASFKVCLFPIICDDNNISRGLYKELDVVGRIEHYTVWDYIYKIKKSPHKDVVIIKLTPASESEMSAYTILYDYLDKRKRLAVVDTPKKSRIKDFYIYPFASKSKLPEILQPLESVDLFEDPNRPNILIGIIIRTLGTRPFVESHHQSKSDSSSPKRRKRDSDDIDIDAIIKAPIASKLQKLNAANNKNETDEPYSPGGSIEDDVSFVPTESNANIPNNEALKREMDEINRKIARQEMEIAGLLNVDPTVKCFAPNASSSSVFSKISIPSNLSQILASIKSKPELSDSTNKKSHTTEHSSMPAITDNRTKDDPKRISAAGNKNCDQNEPKYCSRLAQLTEAELLRMVPDDMIEPHYEEPPPPGV